MITGLANHGLHVIFLAAAMSFFLYRLIITIISSCLYQLGYKLALAFVSRFYPYLYPYSFFFPFTQPNALIL